MSSNLTLPIPTMKEGIWSAPKQPDIEIINGGDAPEGGQLPWITWRLMPMWEGDDPEPMKMIWYEVEAMIAKAGYQPSGAQQKEVKPE